MAVLTDEALEGLNTSSNLPSSSAWTVFFRFQRKGSGGSTGEVLFAVYDGSYGTTAQLTIDGGDLEFYSDDGGYLASGSSSLDDDTWYDVAIVNAGGGATDVEVFFGETNGSWSSLGTTQGSSDTGIAEIYMGFQNSSYFPNAVVADFRYWTAALSGSELAAERQATAPQRSSGLHWFLPMLGATLDDQRADESGNNYDWSISGSPAIVDGPTIETPAPVLSLPGVQDIASTSARPKVTLTYS